MYQVNMLNLIKKLMKPVIITVGTLFALYKCNIFEFITIIPDNYKYDVGLTVYLAFFGFAYDWCDDYINSKRAQIVCTFYQLENVKIICDKSTGTAMICCELQLTGDSSRLRNCKLQMDLPQWLSSQVKNTDIVLEYTSDTLIWTFDHLIPDSKEKQVNVKYNVKIPFINNNGENKVSFKLFPTIKNNKTMIDFRTNGFYIQNWRE